MKIACWLIERDGEKREVGYCVGVGDGIKGEKGKLCSVTFSWDSYCINGRIAVHTQFICEMPEIVPTFAQC
jgi:hypothetical protein